jgi:hypothetical protein
MDLVDLLYRVYFPVLGINVILELVRFSSDKKRSIMENEKIQ